MGHPPGYVIHKTHIVRFSTPGCVYKRAPVHWPFTTHLKQMRDMSSSKNNTTGPYFGLPKSVFLMAESPYFPRRVFNTIGRKLALDLKALVTVALHMCIDHAALLAIVQMTNQTHSHASVSDTWLMQAFTNLLTYASERVGSVCEFMASLKRACEALGKQGLYREICEELPRLGETDECRSKKHARPENQRLYFSRAQFLLSLTDHPCFSSTLHRQRMWSVLDKLWDHVPAFAHARKPARVDWCSNEEEDVAIFLTVLLPMLDYAGAQDVHSLVQMFADKVNMKWEYIDAVEKATRVASDEGGEAMAAAIAARSTWLSLFMQREADDNGRQQRGRHAKAAKRAPEEGELPQDGDSQPPPPKRVSSPTPSLMEEAMAEEGERGEAEALEQQQLMKEQERHQNRRRAHKKKLSLMQHRTSTIPVITSSGQEDALLHEAIKQEGGGEEAEPDFSDAQE